MVEKFKDYLDFLVEELEKRREKNPQYSLRAFARDIDFKPSRLSQVLNRKRGLSVDAARKIAVHLNLDAHSTSIFENLVKAKFGRSKLERKSAREKLGEIKSDHRFKTLPEDKFKGASEWYSHALLELVGIKGVEPSPTAIGKRLGITREKAKQSIDTLKAIGMLEERDGRLHASDEFTAVPGGTPSAALRKLHLDLLMKSKEALIRHDLATRSFSNMIMSFDTADLPELREMIKEFRWKLAKKFGEKPTKNSVYNLSVQFARLDISPEGENKP